MRWLSICLCLAFSAFLYCEFIADYIAIWKCSWPESPSDTGTGENLRAMILADTHLIGPVRGHWLDRLYREWHMRQAFAAAVSVLKPEVVFVLGDLFDEGLIVSDPQFDVYVERFHRIFNVPAHIPMVSVVGNHDVGFHHDMNHERVARFKNRFNTTGVQLYTLKQIHFVLVNSMAMKNDGCSICKEASGDLKTISEKLHCRKMGEKCKDTATLAALKSYSRPILMQHFPTYRLSDSRCREHDAPEVYKFVEHWDVLSKESTDLIGKLINPRVAFSGHSHHYCLSVNRIGIEEYTVATFNWRNKINPSFLLATFTPSNYTVSKCNMLDQRIVFNMYAFAIVSVFLILLYLTCRRALRVAYVKPHDYMMKTK